MVVKSIPWTVFPFFSWIGSEPSVEQVFWELNHNGILYTPPIPIKSPNSPSWISMTLTDYHFFHRLEAHPFLAGGYRDEHSQAAWMAILPDPTWSAASEKFLHPPVFGAGVFGR